MLKKGSQVALVACSNALTDEKKHTNTRCILKSQGLEVRISPHVIAPQGKLAAKAKARADSVMHYFCDPHIDAIFRRIRRRLSQRSIAGTRLPSCCPKPRHILGYSDVTTVINALHTRAGKASVLYQARHLRFARPVGPNGSAGFAPAKKVLFAPEIAWVQGRQMSGVTVGGNVRCLLKLAERLIGRICEGKFWC